jgi:Tfp pilus assembly protein PilW
MMIAMALSLLVLGAAGSLFLQTRKIIEATVKMTDMNENLRAGTELMIRDLTNAAGGIPIGGVSLPGGTGCSAVKRPGPSSTTTFSNCTAGAMGVLPAIAPGQGLGPTINATSSDMITMISVDQTFAVNNVPVALQPTITGHSATCTTASCGTASCSGWVLTVPATPSIAAGSTTAVNVGDLFMFSNATATALGMVTAVNPTAHTLTFDTGDPLSVNQPGAAAGTLRSFCSAGTYPLPLAIAAYKIRLVSYYLDTSQSGNPRLMQQISTGTPLVVADGIHRLQISYDLSDGVTTDVRDVLSLPPHTPNEIRKVNLSIAATSQRLASGIRKIFVNDLNTAVTVRGLAFRNNY